MKWEKTLVLNKSWEAKVAGFVVIGGEEKIGCVGSIRNRVRKMGS